MRIDRVVTFFMLHAAITFCQGQSCDAGAYNRCLVSSTVTFSQGATYTISTITQCYNHYIEYYSYHVRTTSNPPAVSIQVEYSENG